MMFHIILSIFIILFPLMQCKCVDGINNKFNVDSTKAQFSEDLPVMMKNLTILTYDEHMKPSCIKGRPNVKLPGFVKLIGGELIIPEKLELKKHTIVKMSAKHGESSADYCIDGKSTEWYLPDKFCSLDLCDFIGNEMCSVLEKPGCHSVDELIEEIKFDPLLKLPEAPCLVLFCLTDFFGGEWMIEFFFDYFGNTTLHLKIPSNDRSLQIAAFDK